MDRKLYILNDFGAYNLAVRKTHKNFVQILFKQEKVTLYQKLYDPSLEIKLSVLLSKLHELLLKQYNSTVLCKDQLYSEEPLVYDRRGTRRNSMTISKSGKHRQMLYNSLALKSKAQYNTDDWCFKPLSKGSAFDNYNKSYCKLTVGQEIEKNTFRVKDCFSMFYYRIETLLDLNDSDYSLLPKLFGYKCSLVRHPSIQSYLF